MGLGRPQVGAQTFLQVSYMGTRVQALRTSSAALPEHQQRAGWEMEHPELEMVLMWDGSAIGRGLTPHYWPLKFIFIYLNGRERDLSSDSFPDCWGWSRPKLRAQNSDWVSWVGVRTQMLESTPAASQDLY